METTLEKFKKGLPAKDGATAITDRDGAILYALDDTSLGELITLLVKDKDTYIDWHAPLKAFFETNWPDEKLPWGATSWTFLCTNMLARIAPIAVSRADLTRICAEFFHASGIKATKPGDTIQYINKTGQEGLQHLTVKNGDLLYYHFNEFKKSNHKRTKAVISGDKEDQLRENIAYQERRIASMKKDLKEGRIDVGHRNPYGSDSSASNLIAQSSTENRAYRDKYLFDERGNIAGPSPRYLIKKMFYYYSKEAWNTIIRGILKSKPNLLEAETKKEIAENIASTPEGRKLLQDVLDKHTPETGQLKR